jgi:hypothetical protein
MVKWVVFAPKEKELASASWDGYVKLWPVKQYTGDK